MVYVASKRQVRELTGSSTVLSESKPTLKMYSACVFWIWSLDSQYTALKVIAMVKVCDSISTPSLNDLTSNCSGNC